jgi:serine/threonine-protein kinase
VRPAPSQQAETVDAPKSADATVCRPELTKTVVTLDRDQSLARQEVASAKLRFRRALTAGYAIWVSFLLVDWAVVRYLDAGRLLYFAALRLSVVGLVAAPVLAWLYRRKPANDRELRVADLLAFVSGAMVIAFMCVEFRGIASPYVPGLCLVLAARTVMAQDPWRRGLLLSGAPVLAFYTVLLGSALFSPRIAAQLHEPAAVMTLVLNSAYVLGSYVFIVVGGHVVWSLRRQIFEARSLGRYRLKRCLASGAMGDVWVAYHPGLHREVAVKILRAETQARTPGAVARFEREVRATAALVHPNTVRVFDFGTTDDGLLYYVMELLQGENLANHVGRVGPMAPARAVHIVGQAARALAEAHELGIVHRDVKPENLFLTSLGGEHDFVKVLDFGIAKVAVTDATATGTGWVLGTPAYISPEAAAGMTADARADVYGLGAVLYFLLSGSAPFERENVAAVIAAHVSEPPEPPSSRLGQPLPRDLESIVLRALAKDPAQRYPTATAFALALASCDLAGKWTFGEAHAATMSSRPPPPSSTESVAPEAESEGNLRAPRLPSFPFDTGSGRH